MERHRYSSVIKYIFIKIKQTNNDFQPREDIKMNIFNEDQQMHQKYKTQREPAGIWEDIYMCTFPMVQCN